ncbi:hypothetical protein HK104_005709 [Borealophlyctis nickersoniae]|nr:hypothetical protein HK104_005709 [Borealophlyctis nickersoniae]
MPHTTHDKPATPTTPTHNLKLQPKRFTTLRFNPMSDFRKLERTMNRLLSDYLSSAGGDYTPTSRTTGIFTLPTGAQAPSSTSTPPCDWYPPADVLDVGEEYVVSLELPGVAKDKVSVDLKDDSTLLITGELAVPEHYQKATSIYAKERSFGKFARAIPLPLGHFDASKIEAHMKDGVLVIKVAKLVPTVKKINVL